VVADGYTIERVVNHGSGIGCYFLDPEGNTTEVFWRTGRDCWQPTGEPIDLSASDEAILAEVDRVVARSSHVPVGGLTEAVAGR
jgi:catechol-2,3-dioxygenase